MSGEPDDEVQFLPIPDWQRQILTERLEDRDRNPADEQTWEDVKAELQTGDCRVIAPAGRRSST